MLDLSGLYQSSANMFAELLFKVDQNIMIDNAISKTDFKDL